MTQSSVRTVYDFPVAGHPGSDGTVRYTKLVRRSGVERPQGTCAHCQTAFEYQKPKPSSVKHSEGGTTHF